MIMLKLGVLSFVIIDFLCKFLEEEKNYFSPAPLIYTYYKKNYEIVIIRRLCVRYKNNAMRKERAKKYDYILDFVCKHDKDLTL